MSDTGSPRRTQLTVQTSTPYSGRALPEPFTSPTTSSIGSQSNAATPRIFRSRSYSTHPSVSSAEASFTDEDEDEREGTRHPKTRRINVKSKDYLNFQAKRQHGLYRKLTEDPGQSEVLASELLFTVREDTLAGFQSLFEFILDLAGFQHIDIKKIYPYIDVNFETVVELLAGQLSERQKASKYVLAGITSWAKHVTRTAILFFKNLVYKDTDFLLHNANKPNSILKFISVMCSSRYRAICHTGCIIAIKMNSAYCKVAANISAETSFNLTMIKTINEIQKYLFSIIQHVSCISDSHFKNMRTECVKEVWFWFKARPDYFFQSSVYIKYFLKFFQDIAPKVRLNALESCHKLLQSYEQLCSYLTPLQSEIVEKIVTRIQDVNLDVAAKAVDLCTSILELNITSEIPSSQISSLIISNYFPLAAACGRFFIGYLYRITTTSTHFSILDGLLRYCNTILECEGNKVAWVVEAVLDCTPELQNWPVFIKHLLSVNSKLQDREVLLDIFCQSITQTVTGRCEIERRKARKGTIRKSVNRGIVEMFIPNFSLLIQFYGKRKGCVLSLIKTLNVLDFSHLPNEGDNDVNTSKICNSLFGLFKQVNDVEIALAIMNALKILSMKESNFQHIMQRFYNIAENNTVENFKKKISECTEPTGEEIIQLKNVWLRLAAAMEITDVFKKINWNQIFNFEYKNNIECLTYQLTCCKWFISKQTQNYLDSDQNNNILLDDLNQQIHEYAKYLFDLLLSDIDQVNVEAFKQICDIQLAIVEVLEEPIKTNEQLAVLLLEMSEDNVIKKFCNVLENCVFKQQSPLDLQTRKIYLHKSIQWLFKGEPIKYLPRVIGYYGSHYEEFGEVFDAVLDHIKINAPVTFNVLIFETLLGVFKSTKFKQSDVLHSMKEATNLKKIVKQMIETCVKTTADTLPIIQISIRYIQKNLQHLHFFFVLTYFVERLGMDDSTVLYENLKTKIPNEHQQHSGFLNFMAALKKKSASVGRRKRGKPKKHVNTKRMNSTSCEDYSIEDSDDNS